MKQQEKGSCLTLKLSAVASLTGCGIINPCYLLVGTVVPQGDRGEGFWVSVQAEGSPHLKIIEILYCDTPFPLSSSAALHCFHPSWGQGAAACWDSADSCGHVSFSTQILLPDWNQTLLFSLTSTPTDLTVWSQKLDRKNAVVPVSSCLRSPPPSLSFLLSFIK